MESENGMICSDEFMEDTAGNGEHKGMGIDFVLTGDEGCEMNLGCKDGKCSADRSATNGFNLYLKGNPLEGIIEENGPPRYDVLCGDGVTRAYRTLALAARIIKAEPCPVSKLMALLFESLSKIKAELLKKTSQSAGFEPVLYWRIKPGILAYFTESWGSGLRVKINCRLQTYPELPDRFYESLPVPLKLEGSITKVMQNEDGIV